MSASEIGADQHTGEWKDQPGAEVGLKVHSEAASRESRDSAEVIDWHTDRQVAIEVTVLHDLLTIKEPHSEACHHF